MDFIRGLAIVLVILHHAEGQIRANVGSYPQVLVIANDLAAPFRMPLLMMLSGFLLSKSLNKPASRYLTGKIRSIAWPYLVWSSILVALLIMSGNVQGGQTPFGAIASIFYNPPTYLWYLAYLLVFYVGALVLRPLGAARGWGMPLGLAAAAIVPDGNWSRMLFLLVFFLLGDALSSEWDHIAEILRTKPAIIFAGGLAATAAIASAMGITVNYQPFWALNIAAIFVVLVPMANRAMKYRPSALVARIGEGSIVFYCTHFVFLMIAFNTLERAGATNASFLAVVLISGAVGLGWVLMELRRFRLVDALFVWPALGRATVRPKAMAS